MNRPISVPCAAAALALALLTGPSLHAAEPLQLITKVEASLPEGTAGAGQERNLTRGPGIDRIAPSVVSAAGGPFRFALRFKPRNSVPIDPASVKVTYIRNPAVDLTARVKPFVTADGVEIPEALVPPGRHVIEIEATDKEGRLGRRQIILTGEAAQ